MKKITVYLLGLLTGVVLTFLVSILIARGQATNHGDAMAFDPGIDFFDTPGDVMPNQGFKVIQVLNDNAALAWAEDDMTLTVLLYDKTGSAHYYDDQSVTAGVDECFRRIGSYQYMAKYGQKTVPVVAKCEK